MKNKFKMQYKRRDFLKTSGLGMFALTIPGCSSTRTDKRPNILFILSDDHPDRAMSCYGSVVNTTPHMDRIANGGMRFDQAYITMSLCAPSRASILTGTYPHINGQVTIGRVFDGNQSTFPRLLHDNGYNTAVVGKWHLTSEPVGFDYWNVLINQGTYFDPDMVENGKLNKYSGYTTDIITDHCINWLDSIDKEKPFCLFCSHKSPHYVCEPDAKHEHMYDDIVFPEPDTFNQEPPHSYPPSSLNPERPDWPLHDLHIRLKNHRRWQNLPEGLSPEERKKDNYQRFMRDMLGVVASMDDNIGRLLDYLDEHELTENTIVVYMSDNGYYMGEHGWIDKKSPYENSLRVPLLVRYPKGIKPNSSSSDFVVNIDLAPTILDYAGVGIPSITQGESLRPLLEGKTPSDWRDAVYFQYYSGFKNYAYYCIRTERYKLIHFYDELNAWEFYDLEKDPNELHNAYNDPGCEETISLLKKKMSELREKYEINEEHEQAILSESKTDKWRKEVNAYREQKMKEWKQ